MKHTPALALIATVAAGCLTGTLLASNADQTITGPDFSRFGFQVESRFIHNVDTDLLGRLTINSGTAISAPEPGVDEVYIFDDADLETGADLDVSDAWIFEGPHGSEAGWALSAGNLTTAAWGDDLVIAAPSALGGKGQVYVLNMYEGKKGDDYILATISGDDSGDYMGWDVATGNFNNDGYDDLVIGACGTNEFDGAVHVFYGPLSGSLAVSHADISISGTQNIARFGCQVEVARLDDWTDDLIVGASWGWNDDAKTPDYLEEVLNGKVHIFWNPKPGTYDDTDIDNQTIIVGDHSFANLGFSLDAGASVNNDDIEDLLIGAPSNYCHSLFDNHPDDYKLDRCSLSEYYGQAFVVLGDYGDWSTHATDTIDISDIAAASVSGTVDMGEVGHDVALVGDLNSDGLSDMFVGTRGLGEGYLAYGFSPVHLDTTNTALTVLKNVNAEQVMGTTGGYLGDISGDGIDDMLVTAPGQLWIGQPTTVDGVGYIWHGQK